MHGIGYTYTSTSTGDPPTTRKAPVQIIALNAFLLSVYSIYFTSPSFLHPGSSQSAWVCLSVCDCITANWNAAAMFFFSAIALPACLTCPPHPFHPTRLIVEHVHTVLMPARCHCSRSTAPTLSAQQSYHQNNIRRHHRTYNNNNLNVRHRVEPKVTANHSRVCIL